MGAIGVNGPVMVGIAFWTVVGTKQASSHDAFVNLNRQSFQTYRPLYRERSHGGVRRITALFAYYLFVRVRNTGWDAVRSTRGVKQMHMNGSVPARISDEHIEYFQGLEDELGYVVPEHEQAPRFTPRQEVRGVAGLFEGKQGIYQGLAGTSADRVRVLFSILSRPVVFDVSAFDLAPA